jgi:hypothetical protein
MLHFLICLLPDSGISGRTKRFSDGTFFISGGFSRRTGVPDLWLSHVARSPKEFPVSFTQNKGSNKYQIFFKVSKRINHG